MTFMSEIAGTIQIGDRSRLFKGRMAYILRILARFANNLATQLDQSSAGYSLSEEDKSLLAKNEIFRNRHQGKRCFIIGNGPSLAGQDLAPLANELTFVMSGFWKHPILEKWQPKYYFFADSLFFDGSEPMHKFFIDLGSCVRSTTFFVPLSAREAIRKETILPIDVTYFVAFHESLGKASLSELDITRIAPGVMSVSQFAIMAAMFMGCSPIYLLGLDHDWLAHRSMDRHFYEGKTIENHSKAHGDLSRISYKSDIESALELWNGYENLQKFSKSKKISIYNATHGGFLDVFERVDYESLF